MKLRYFLLIAALLVGLSAASFAGVFISVGIAPPPIPVYTQPMCPGAGYIWTPGYWAWGDEGYYWVPGTWVEPPEVGMLWTPGYWGWNNGAYMWNAGYWGPQVGFYGGIDYGFGYTGRGYEGGYWRGHDFYYNRSVNNVNVTNIHNIYNKNVVVNNHDRVSYNGGRGGIDARPTAEQERLRSERHVEETAAQRQHVEAASHNRELFARNNGGKPAIAATERPNDFKHVVPAKAVGGHVDRASLEANARTAAARPAAARNEKERPATTSRNEGTVKGREVARPANATESHTAAPRTETSHNVPKPPNATTEHHANETARSTDRPSAATSARNENAHNVPKPSNASRTENAHNVPKPPSASHNENAHVSAPAPHAEAAPRTTAATHENTSHPPAARSEHESNSRAMGMPQGESAVKAPAHNSAPHEAPRHEAAAPGHAETHAAPAAHESHAAPKASEPKASAPKESEKKPK